MEAIERAREDKEVGMDRSIKVLWVIIITVVLGITAYVINIIAEIGESVGWVNIVVGIGVITGIVVWRRVVKRKRRREKLMNKYRDEELVEELMNGSFWKGQTYDQLIDSLGNPEEVEEKIEEGIIKTKKKEIWKYDKHGGNRYGLSITLENGVVVGWDKKT
ncbi:hypothetical protein [Nitrosococcus wardiae]|uniref:DUF2845 domain-containing protein n=1 Tax=Nitrosococcus wardiae TaxID=1814290 RepID=A0A4P7C0J5_9GAMM|nr:hypothetical protein [Nitrosococcus wardiae]QBQ55050.1 hypothetical protein E3U44_11400 [Nitrosococcus wardiae]